MPEAELNRSNVVPVLVAALVCDAAVADPASGKKNLIGIFDRMWVGRFPTARPMFLYWKITDAEGRYRITVRIVHANRNKEVGKAEVEVQVHDRLLASDFLLELPPVPFEEEGRYEFQILMNDMYLGSAVVDAQLAPKQPAEG